MSEQSPEQSNALAHEKSPYLLQHAHNPVNWLPWGEDAFERARAENKPIFLSVGYSTCHWCHVMERESFENPDTARLMNEHFISVKVDREERPDVDRLYMTFVQAATGQGGWPMSVFLTPEGKPFYGGTYYPPRDAYGRPGFSTLLQRLSEAWNADRSAVETSAGNALQMLQRYAAVSEEPDGTVDWNALCDNAYATLASEFDNELGGFGDAPKFPRPGNHDFLHRYAFARYSANSVPALRMSALTLRAMHEGGMNDQLGGGFHRYSVDARWVVPHFEKMLYDQAQLVASYVEMFQLTGEARYAQAVRATLDYVLRDMTHPDGGFFAAEDADSFASLDDDHKEEGAFFVWSAAEFDAICGDDAPLVRRFYNVRANGNAPRQGDPHGEFKGKNILFQSETLVEVAKHFSLTPDDAAVRIAAASAKLFEIREKRSRPHRDEKVIVAWNGLMIAAFARAAQALNEPRYTEAAQRAAAFIQRELWDTEAGTLRRHFKDGAAAVAAFADDYAFLADGLLDLYEADFDSAHLSWAETLLDSLDRGFYDLQGGGYFNAPVDPLVPVRFKEDYDGAEPSANSVAVRVGLRLAEILDSAERRERAEATLRAFAARLQLAAHAMPLMLGAALRAQTPPLHIVIVGPRDREDTRALLSEVHGHFLPFRTLLVVEQENALAERLPFTQGMKMVGDQATAYVCRDFACQQPVTTPQGLHEQLEAFNHAAHGG